LKGISLTNLSRSIEWWQEARFGIFIHWGLYSIHGRDVWSMYSEQTPIREYRRLADAFVPGHWDPSEWAALAKDAGAGYLVLCTRQHDGFSLFDSKVSRFTSVKCAAQRDFVAEYAEAMRNAGLGVGFYYSLLDWRLPAYFSGPEDDPEGWADFRAYVHEQIRELCTQYGKIDILWYDGAWPYDKYAWCSDQLNAMVKELQPGILINDRSANRRGGFIGANVTGVYHSDEAPGDFSTPEQTIPARVSPKRPWESCMTINDHWGFNPADGNWKSTTELIHNLVRCASRNGNCLLNIGPDPDGRIPSEAVKRLRQMGRWLRSNGESVYGAQVANVAKVGPVQSVPTVKGNTLYIHVWHWPGNEIILGNLGNTVLSARLLATGVPVDFRQEGSRVFLSNLPAYAPDEYDTVIALECDCVPRSVRR
jgi:alpha-L-fucosidase